VERIQHLLSEIGFEPERVKMFDLSAAMANKFVEAANEMTEQIASLKPNPLRVSTRNKEQEK
jgi:coenzyme F420-reducing hydrogenase delta subunit